MVNGGRWWIRTTVAEATGLQPAPFNHSGNLPEHPGTIRHVTLFEADFGVTILEKEPGLAMGLEPATNGLQNRRSTN